jgi:hypothetical protein
MFRQRSPLEEVGRLGQSLGPYLGTHNNHVVSGDDQYHQQPQQSLLFLSRRSPGQDKRMTS